MRAHEEFVGGDIGGFGDRFDAEGAVGEGGVDGRVWRGGVDDLFVGGHCGGS